jgi:hypothetical protein
MEMDFTPITLRNQGVPVRMAVLDPLTGKPTYGLDGKPTTAVEYLQFDNNVLAEFEGAFGSVEEFVGALDKKPYQALRLALSIALDVEPKTAANKVPNDENGLADVVAALFVALAISQGVDPTRAASAYPQAVATLRETQAETTRQLSDLLDSIGQPSTPPSTESNSDSNSEPSSTDETSSEDESSPLHVAPV